MLRNEPGAKRLQFSIWVLAVVFLSLGFARAEENAGTFKFTKIDMELLAKANQADQEFDRKGLVFEDPEAAAYIEEIGKKVIPETPLENVNWRFRVLRDAHSMRLRCRTGRSTSIAGCWRCCKMRRNWPVSWAMRSRMS